MSTAARVYPPPSSAKNWVQGNSRERSKAILGLEESAVHWYLRGSAPRAVGRVIGHVLPRDATVDSARLDGHPTPTPTRLVETARGLEVRVVTDTDRPHSLAVSVD